MWNIAPQFGYPSRFLRSIDDVVGREAAQTIAANQPLVAKLLRNPTLVQRGDVVDVRSIPPVSKSRPRPVRNPKAVSAISSKSNSSKHKQAMVARVSGLQTVEILGSAEPNPNVAEDKSPW